MATLKNAGDLMRPDLNLTLGGRPVSPWWNMIALAKLKKDHKLTMEDVLNHVLDPDVIVPFYWVGLESRSPGQYTLENVQEQLDFFDLMQLQGEMAKLVKAFGLDTVPLPVTNGAKPGLSVASTSG